MTLVLRQGAYVSVNRTPVVHNLGERGPRLSYIADLRDAERLRQAHDCNDELLARIRKVHRANNDTERPATLFETYTRMTTKPRARI